MRRKLLIGLAVVVGLVVVLVGVIAMQPSEFRVERSAVMAAPPAAVFAQVNDFHKWEAWSPWAKLDPQATSSFEGASEGEGAIFRWAGNAEVGKGSMTILESRPLERIRIRLDFAEPFEDTSTAEFTFHPEGEGTRVTWSMFGRNNFLSKALCLVMNMDQMVGGKFDEGLASIKQIVETDRHE